MTWPLRAIGQAASYDADEQSVKTLLWLEKKGYRCAAMGGAFITDTELPAKAQAFVNEHQQDMIQLLKYCESLQRSTENVHD